jgi:hypothetical protein
MAPSVMDVSRWHWCSEWAALLEIEVTTSGAKALGLFLTVGRGKCPCANRDCPPADEALQLLQRRGWNPRLAISPNPPVVQGHGQTHGRGNRGIGDYNAPRKQVARIAANLPKITGAPT